MDPKIESKAPNAPTDWQKISEFNVTDENFGVQQVDFSGLDFTKYRSYKVIASGETADINYLIISFNDDGEPTNYSLLTENVQGTSISVFTNATSNRWPIGHGKHNYELTLMNNDPYLFGFGFADTSGTLKAIRSVLRWNAPTFPINKLTLQYSGDGANLFVGSQFTLYGLR